jgi:hypothetical protein
MVSQSSITGRQSHFPQPASRGNSEKRSAKFSAWNSYNERVNTLAPAWRLADAVHHPTTRALYCTCLPAPQ